MADRLSRIFREHGLDVAITQCRVSEIAAYEDDVDVIVTTAQIARSSPVPIVNGIPFLSGIGEEEAIRQVLQVLKGA